MEVAPVNHWYDWVFWIFAAGVVGFILWIWVKMLIEPFRTVRRARASKDDERWSLMSATSGDTSSMTFSSSNVSSSSDAGSSDSGGSDSGGGFESGGGDFGGGGSSGGWND